MTFDVIDVVPDTPRWEEERRKSLGASDIPAILSLSPYPNATPRNTWRAKMGRPSDFDPELSYTTHASEPVIQGWVQRFAAKKYPQWATRIPARLEPGFMARSIEHPWLHATFDRISRDHTGSLVTWQFKTAHYYAGHHWDDGVPLDVQAQVQGEIAVADTAGAWVVIWIGGRDYRMFWIERDEDFIAQLLRIGEAWWSEHVVAEVEPEPTSMTEIEAEKFNTGNMIDGDQRLLMAWYLDGLERSTYKAAEEKIEAVKAAYKELLSQAKADGLTYGGKPLYTWKRSKDVISFDKAWFEAEHPELVERYTHVIPGSLRFLRKQVKDFEADPPEGWEPGLTVIDVLSTYGELSAWKEELKESPE